MNDDLAVEIPTQEDVEEIEHIIANLHAVGDKFADLDSELDSDTAPSLNYIVLVARMVTKIDDALDDLGQVYGQMKLLRYELDFEGK